MTSRDIQSDMTTIFRMIFNDDSLVLNPQMTANDVEEWDSLNHINLIVAVEKEFEIKFTTKEISSMKNVGDFIGLIKKKL